MSRTAGATRGTPGQYGGAFALPYTFSTTTTDADPGNGILRGNGGAGFTSSSQLIVDLLSKDGTDWTAGLDAIGNSTSTVKGQIRLSKLSDPSKWILFNAGVVTTATGYRKLGVTYAVGSVSTFTDGDIILFEFTRSGDKGDTGAAGTSIALPTVPTTTSSNGTATAGSTVEIRDAVLGDYVFTAVAGHRYRVVYAGCKMSSSVAGDLYIVNIRDGGGSSPTTSSTILAAAAWYIPASGGPGQQSRNLLQTVLGLSAGTHTLSAFTQRSAGTGAGTPVGTRELYVEDIGTV